MERGAQELIAQGYDHYRVMTYIWRIPEIGCTGTYSFLLLKETPENLAETCMLISSALIPSLALSHILGIPGTTVTEHIGFT